MPDETVRPACLCGCGGTPKGRRPAAATGDQLLALVALLVERIETVTQRVARVIWTPPARPFFRDASAEADEDGALVWRPRRGSSS